MFSHMFLRFSFMLLILSGLGLAEQPAYAQQAVSNPVPTMAYLIYGFGFFHPSPFQSFLLKMLSS